MSTASWSEKASARHARTHAEIEGLVKNVMPPVGHKKGGGDHTPHMTAGKIGFWTAKAATSD